MFSNIYHSAERPKNQTDKLESIGVKDGKQVLVQMAAAMTSVLVYHPMRTVATQLCTRAPIQYSCRALYRGFRPSIIGAHQLMIMGSAMKFLEQERHTSAIPQIVQGILAGAVSAPLATPCEALTVYGQLNIQSKRGVSTLFRGFTMISLRQMGLGIGMFIIPGIVAKKGHEAFPSFTDQHDQVTKIASSCIGGYAAVIITHVPEVARTLMQADPNGIKYPTARAAMQIALQEIPTPRGRKMFFVRLNIIGVAAVVMNSSREIYAKFAEAL